MIIIILLLIGAPTPLPNYVIGVIVTVFRGLHKTGQTDRQTDKQTDIPILCDRVLRHTPVVLVPICPYEERGREGKGGVALILTAANVV